MNVVHLIVFAIFVLAVLARRPILNKLGFIPNMASYQPSKIVEAGLLIAAIGLLAPVALAEASLASYDAAFSLTVSALTLGLVAMVIGVGLELSRNFHS